MRTFDKNVLTIIQKTRVDLRRVNNREINYLMNFFGCKVEHIKGYNRYRIYDSNYSLRLYTKKELIKMIEDDMDEYEYDYLCGEYL